MSKPLVLTTALLACLALTAAASAEVRTGTATDPVGDSLGGPGGDLVSARAVYDTTGSLVLSATTVGPPSGLFAFQVASSSGLSCLGPTATLWGIVPDSVVAVAVGASLVGTGTPVVSGETVTFTASGPAVANEPWSCVTVAVSDPRGGNTLWDQLDAPAYFGGHVPDSDGDGVPDYADDCPTIAAPGAANGCPPNAGALGQARSRRQVVKVPRSCKRLVEPRRVPCVTQAIRQRR